MGKIVSIRCRRHKKRFNVEERWLKTSRWLCPQCYDKLTESEREAYAPKTSEPVKVREAEPNKAVVGRSKTLGGSRDGYRSVIAAFLDRKRRSESKDIHEPIRPKQPNQTVSPVQTPSMADRFESLKPEHTVHCKKCGEDYPCHSFWLKKSKVLCPACAADMTDEQIRMFNIANGGDVIPETNRESHVKSPPPIPVPKIRKRISGKDSDTVESGRPCSDLFIKTATVGELMEAVRKGKLSRIRAKIELRRRAKPDYYDGCPESVY